MRDEYDFSKAARAKDVPHLAKLQNEAKGKSRITIMIDNDVLEQFRTQASLEGIGYQTLINQVLRSTLGNTPMNETTLRKIIREELSASLSKSA